MLCWRLWVVHTNFASYQTPSEKTRVWNLQWMHMKEKEVLLNLEAFLRGLTTLLQKARNMQILQMRMRQRQSTRHVHPLYTFHMQMSIWLLETSEPHVWKMVSTLWTSACINFRHVYIALVKHVADVCLDQQVATVAQSSIRRLQMVVKEKEEAILSLQNAVSAAYQAALQEQAHNQAQLEALHAVLSVHAEHSIEHMHKSLQVVHRLLFMSNRFPPAGSTCIITYSGITL